MPFRKYVVSCDGCDFRKHHLAIDPPHAIAEALWYLGIIQWRESTKCPECGGQLKAEITAELSTLAELKQKLDRSWEPADDK